MTDFKIKRGLSTTMFIAPGVINPRLIIEEGHWYLCTDTAELFLGVKVSEDLGEEKYTLKQINGTNTSELDPSISNEVINDLKSIVEKLQNEVAVLEDVELFQKITGEGDLPSNFESDDFNPNITYYTYTQEDGILRTYIFDKGTQSYLCSISSGSTGLGISKVEINANGELVVQYTDGTEDIVGKVVGTDGLTTSIKVGNKLYTQTNGVIELPTFATQEYVETLLREFELPKVPTKLSELENDTGYISKDSVPVIIELFAGFENDQESEQEFAVSCDFDAFMSAMPNVAAYINYDLERYPARYSVGAGNSCSLYADITPNSSYVNNYGGQDMFIKKLLVLSVGKGSDGSWTARRTIKTTQLATEDWIKYKGFINEIPEEYITTEELAAEGFLKEHQDLSDYAKKSEIPSVAGLATETFVRNAIAQAELGDSNIDLSDYLTKDDLTDYATKGYVAETISNAFDAVILHGGDATPEE